MCWRVGTGSNISINDNAWIPDAVNFKVSSVVNTMQYAEVSELIDSNARIWNRELIDNTFSTVDAGKILRIPLACTLHDDLLVWGCDHSGEFSVRSAYKLLQIFDEFPRAYALQTNLGDFYKKIMATKFIDQNKDYSMENCLELSAYEGEYKTSKTNQ